MNTWFTINLGDAMMADESLDNIKALFETEYQKANRPQNMAVFCRHESEGRLHCEVKVYFSPASANVAKVLGAIPCSRPASASLELLAGSKESWSVSGNTADL